ncbi:MAG: hypothetical protein HOO96_04520 [Polyangiaceae bacterium]|nr:hypothetical protein [Polyangiaceae bacterium]
MPYIQVALQSGDFTPEAVDTLAVAITKAAGDAEQIPDDPAHRASVLLQVLEIPRGRLYSAGSSAGAQAARFVAIQIFSPDGVLDHAHRAELFRAIDVAAKDAGRHGLRAEVPVLTSIVNTEVENGSWGIFGHVSWLSDLAARAGYAHLAPLFAKR